jgi:hypothetical protein
MSDDEIKKEILALSAQTLAHGILLGNILSKLARIPSVRAAIIEGFDQSSDVADSVAIQFGAAASPEHTMKAVEIIDDLRVMVLGDQPKTPKSLI